MHAIYIKTQHFYVIYLLIANNVLATQTRQPPTRDSARASQENQNQNIKILLYYTTTTPPLCPLLPPNCCRLIKKIECKLFFNYWKPILINLAVYLPEYTVCRLLLFTLVVTAANRARSITKSFKSSQLLRRTPQSNELI